MKSTLITNTKWSFSDGTSETEQCCDMEKRNTGILSQEAIATDRKTGNIYMIDIFSERKRSYCIKILLIFFIGWQERYGGTFPLISCTLME